LVIPSAKNLYFYLLKYFANLSNFPKPYWGLLFLGEGNTRGVGVVIITLIFKVLHFNSSLGNRGLLTLIGGLGNTGCGGGFKTGRLEEGLPRFPINLKGGI